MKGKQKLFYKFCNFLPEGASENLLDALVLGKRIFNIRISFILQTFRLKKAESSLGLRELFRICSKKAFWGERVRNTLRDVTPEHTAALRES